MKRRKWYSANIKPDKASSDLIVMTDMGYIFQAKYENDEFLVSIMRNFKIYFEPWIPQSSIIKWMKV